MVCKKKKEEEEEEERQRRRRRTAKKKKEKKSREKKERRDMWWLGEEERRRSKSSKSSGARRGYQSSLAAAGTLLLLLLLSSSFCRSNAIGINNHDKSNNSNSSNSNSNPNLNNDELLATSARRALRVRKAIRHAWHGYLDFAHLSDDLKPVSRTGDNWLHVRTTFYDALDTLHVAGLSKEFDDAISEILPSLQSSLLHPWSYWHQGVPTSIIYPVKTFEYHLRIVGGLLGAFMMSGRRELLHSARFAVDCVLVAFETPNGMPRPHTRMSHPTITPVLSGVARMLDWIRISTDSAVWCNTLAGLGSFGIELRVLSRELGVERYRDIANAVHEHIHRQWLGEDEMHKDGYQAKTWIVPPDTWWSRRYHDSSQISCGGNVDVGFGSGGDSYYEYLLKETLLERRRVSGSGGGSGSSSSGSDSNGSGSGSEGVVETSSSARSMMELYDALVQSLFQGADVAGDDDDDDDDEDEDDGEVKEKESRLTAKGETSSVASPLHPSNTQRHKFKQKNRAVRRSEDGSTVYVVDLNSLSTSHLSCFSGGLLALGTYQLGRSLKELELGMAITEQCAQSYLQSPSGLGSEFFSMNKRTGAIDMSGGGKNNLRPEVVESLFVLWRTTNNEKWRNYGWKIFQKFEKHCRVDSGGFSGVKNNNAEELEWDDYQPSFFLAETLKYLYLMFATDSNGENLLPLNQYVFTTEAHPMTLDRRCINNEKERDRIERDGGGEEGIRGDRLKRKSSVIPCTGPLAPSRLQVIPWDAVLVVVVMLACVSCWCCPKCCRNKKGNRYKSESEMV